MRRTFSFPIKAFSINSLHYNDRRHGYTQDAKNWIDTIVHLLNKSDNAQKMSELREAFNQNENAFSIQIKCHIPRDVYYTKDGKLSRRSFDVTNFEKPLVDVLFLEKFKAGLCVDDCVLKSCHSIKLPSPDGQWRIDVAIKIVKN